jgi:hypothetical protein
MKHIAAVILFCSGTSVALCGGCRLSFLSLIGNSHLGHAGRAEDRSKTASEEFDQIKVSSVLIPLGGFVLAVASGIALKVMDRNEVNHPAPNPDTTPEQG